MKSIAIVGAGQSGLQLALALLGRGYEVTVISNRTAEQIRTGKVMSSQCMFDASLQTERELGLNWWDTDCPPIDGFGVTVTNPEEIGTKLIDWVAPLDGFAQSVDQRVKMPAWMAEFERRGGNLVIKDAGVEELEEYSQTYDLVVIAAGKGDIVKLFERDEVRSVFASPQRALALTYVTGVEPRSPLPGITFTAIPGIGEWVMFPGLTTTGPCEIMTFFGIPGGPLDCWGDVKTPEQHLEKTMSLLKTYVPWGAERCRNAQLTDDNGFLSGRVTPTVRKPVVRLPSGRFILGMADVVVVGDPINGQGSNNAAKCATSYLHSILALGEQQPTQEWMQQTFEQFWNYADYVVSWSAAMLRPPEPHVLNLLGAAGQLPSVAHAIVNGFNHPPSLFPWWLDAKECEKFIALKASEMELTA
ncbi:styrene monooxygenase/indole monooxygenase family protein [Polaromonas hydrogenivorans]|uniref:Styrene monooxygenase/indole monooxygenase family protein n=1 Tax=Polaromonas hydrogenivorans TaxID=335476 RepID=A0AAU7LYV7_9BURK